MHTFRCGHATGEDEEYINEAIKAGFKYVGFSDHVFFPGVIQQGIRMEESLAEDYRSSVLALKNKYKNEIEILLGFEAEYYPEFRDRYESWIKEGYVDYLILGEHVLKDEDGIYVPYWFAEKSSYYVKKYTDYLIEAMSTGIFSYVAHPDLFLNVYPLNDEFSFSLAKKICEASIKYDVPLEVNVEGMRHKLKNNTSFDSDSFYPHGSFWKLAGEMGCKVVVGVDAHQPTGYNDFGIKEVNQLIKKYNLNLVKDFRIKENKVK